MSDDRGYSLGLLNGDIITPNLDRLAKEGTRLTSFYVAWPACTRGAFLSGRYPQRNGIYDMIVMRHPTTATNTIESYTITWERIGGMDVREILIPKVLDSKGYYSGIFGIWVSANAAASEGFNEFYGLVNTGIDYIRTSATAFIVCIATSGRKKIPVSTRPICSSEALRFLDEREQDEPFSSMFPSMLPMFPPPWIPKLEALCGHLENSKRCIQL